MKRKLLIPEFDRLNDSAIDQKRRKRLIFIVTLLFSVFFIVFANRLLTQRLPDFSNTQMNLVRAKVLSITKQEIKPSEFIHEDGSQKGLEHFRTLFEAEILDGSMKGKRVSVVQDIVSLQENVEPQMLIKGNETVFIGQSTPGAATEWSVFGFERISNLLILLVIFSALLLLFGRFKGLNTLLSLLITCAAVFLVLIPAVLSGHNPYLWTSIVCIFIILMSLLIINGLNEKTITAGLASIMGMAVASLLMIVMNAFLKMTGFTGEEAMYLSRINPGVSYDIKAIMYSAIMLGATGAVMDVSMDIASSLQELAQSQGKDISFSALIKSGIEIGKDSIGTMVNTLILAYVGGSFISLLLLISINLNNLFMLLNSEGMIAELLQMLIGAFSMLFTIPFATLIAAILYTKKYRVSEHIIGKNKPHTEGL